MVNLKKELCSPIKMSLKIGAVELIATFLSILLSFYKLSEVLWTERYCSRDYADRNVENCRQTFQPTLAGLVDENSSDSLAILNSYKSVLWISIPLYSTSFILSVLLLSALIQNSRFLKLFLSFKILELLPRSGFLWYTLTLGSDKGHDYYDACYFTRPFWFDWFRVSLSVIFILAAVRSFFDVTLDIKVIRMSNQSNTEIKK